jgi:hypothetical protein
LHTFVSFLAVLTVEYAQSHQKRARRSAPAQKERATAKGNHPGSGSDDMYLAKILITGAT